RRDRRRRRTKRLSSGKPGTLLREAASWRDFHRYHRARHRSVSFAAKYRGPFIISKGKTGRGYPVGERGGFARGFWSSISLFSITRTRSTTRTNAGSWKAPTSKIGRGLGP